MMTGGGSMHLNDSLGFEPRLHVPLQPPRAGLRHRRPRATARVTGKPAAGQRDDGPWRHERAHRRVRRVDRFDPDAGHLGPGQARDPGHAATTLPGCGSSAIRRSTSSRMVEGDHQVRGARARSRSRSAITSRRRCTSPRTAGPGRAGSTSRSTCRRRRSTRTQLAATTPKKRARSALTGRSAGAVPRDRSSASRRRAPGHPGRHRASGSPGAAETFRSAWPRSSACPSRRRGRAIDLVCRPMTRCSAAGRARSATAPATSPCRTPTSLLVLGSRLNIRQVSYNWRSFARARVQDPGRRRRGRADQADACARTWASHATPRVFLEELNRQLDAAATTRARHDGWLGVVQGAGGAVSRCASPSTAS